MIKKYLPFVAWALYFGFIAYRFSEGTLDWPAALIGLGLATAIYIWSFGFEYLEKRFDVGEARFDSKTGKLMKGDERI